MRRSAELEQAIRDVLPALNLEPTTFELARGFLARAERGNTPSPVALNTMADLAVFVGALEEADPDTAAMAAARRALDSLSEHAGEACERMVVAWSGPADGFFAAAFVVAADGAVGSPLASSWLPPDSWPVPTIDAAVSGGEGVERALVRLRETVRARHSAADLETALDRSFRLIDLALGRYGGEGQNVASRPDAAATEAVWEAWLDRYERAIREEWRRVEQAHHSDHPGFILPTADGALAGVHVFLSYARPDAATLARPVHEALTSQGATVWFDQEQQPDKASLDVGLSEAVGACDAFVMCASDEYVERAGYATQEVAWAVEHRDTRARTRHFLVVARRDTILPSIVADWPAIVLDDHEEDELGYVLSKHLRGSPSFAPSVAARSRATATPEPIVLARKAEMSVHRSRVRHMRRFDEIGQDAYVRVAGGREGGRREALLRERLLSVGDGLDWLGTFADLDGWPADSVVRDYRTRLAAMRALAGTRWPLSGDLDQGPDVSEELAFLATRPAPPLAFEPSVGWAENERRLALRFYGGCLRTLDELLARGLTAGALGVSQPTISAWRAELYARRRECFDALIAQRMHGLVSWQRDPPTWDRLFSSWHELMTTRDGSWSPAIPAYVRAMLTSNADDLAAVAADTGWYAVHTKLPAAQVTTARRIDAAPVRVSVSAEDTEANGRAVIRIAWETLSADVPAGESERSAPGSLRQGINIRTS